MHDDDDEGVGYGKPPKHSRFKKGQSGNPFGRRGQKAKPETQSEVVRRVRDEMVTIKRNGKEVQVTAFEAMVRTVFSKTMQRGSSREMKLLLDLLERYGAMSVVDEGQRAKEGADEVYNKIMTMFCRENDISEEEHATSERRRREEIEILFAFPQAIAALRRYWKAEDKTEFNETVHWTSLRAFVEKHWREM